MKKLITTGAAAAVALTGLGLAPAMAETTYAVGQDPADFTYGEYEATLRQADRGITADKFGTVEPVDKCLWNTDPTGMASWHFVIPPKSDTDFQLLDIAFTTPGGDTEYKTISDAITPAPLLGDAYIVTPQDWVLTDGTARFTSKTSRDDDNDIKFNLSHTCVGDPGGPEDVLLPPTVTKTVMPSYTRTFDWTIEKSVDAAEKVTAKLEHTANYTVTATKSPGVDSDFALTGTISVKNPNDTEDIVITKVTDVLDLEQDVTCEIGAYGAEVPAGKTREIDYNCDLGDEMPSDAETGTNIATVDWSLDSADELPDVPMESVQSSGAEWDFANAVVTTYNDKATITDVFEGTDPVILGTIDKTTTFPVYGRDLPVPDAGCDTFENVATVTGEDFGTHSDDASVKVCRATNVGGYTIGFWHNKNGQSFLSKNEDAVRSAIANYTPFEVTDKLAAWVYDIVTADVSHDRVAMFDKQYLATVLSTVRTPELLTTTIKVDGEYVTVGDLLTETKERHGEDGIFDGDDQEREALKDIFDALNNNEQPIFDL